MRLTPTLFLMLAPVLGGGIAAEVRIDALRPVQEVFSRPDKSITVVIRRFERDQLPYVLAVDADRLIPEVAGQEAMSLWKREQSATLARTHYGKLLDAHCSAPFPLQNDGLTRADGSREGWILTVDMCPSKRRFEQQFFERVAALGTPESPVPIALCMTGRWMREHPEEFAWLRGQASRGNLAVTWVNHSWSHPYDPKLPLEKNFLLTEEVNFDEEILRTERLLLENGLTPSPFFRFPGLVSDAKQMERLRAFGLIPLGADAWINKGQLPKPGSIILLHGNGNEHDGIVKFFGLLPQETAPGIPGKSSPKFLPLPDALTASR